jgi:hypothetical protein
MNTWFNNHRQGTTTKKDRREDLPVSYKPEPRCSDLFPSRLLTEGKTTISERAIDRGILEVNPSPVKQENHLGMPYSLKGRNVLITGGSK